MGGGTNSFEGRSGEGGHSERVFDVAPSITEFHPCLIMPRKWSSGLMDRMERSAPPDTSMIAHIGALIAKGASKLSTDEPVEGQSRSSLMATLISKADAKRRCLETHVS